MTFDEQVAALRGKVDPKPIRKRKSDCTPQEWAAKLEYKAKERSLPHNQQRSREYKREYQKKHSKSLTEKAAKYAKENPEQRKATAKRYYERNKSACLRRQVDWQSRKLKSCVQYKLRVAIRDRIKTACRFGLKAGSAIRDLGCSTQDLKTYLEAKFLPGMSWDNHGTWHIDHVQPLAKFDLTDPEQFKMACHYTNLQPLWAADNLSKGAA